MVIMNDIFHLCLFILEKLTKFASKI